MGKLFFSLVFVVSMFCSQTMAFAGVGDFYSVDKVSVSASSTSSSEARKLALQNARGKVFGIVLSRILLPEDVGQVLIPDAYNLEKFVKSLRINGEKTTSTAYSADVNMVLDEKMVNAYLANQGFVFLREKLPMTMLVLRGVNSFDFGLSDLMGENYNVVPYMVAYSHAFDFDVASAGLSKFRAKFPDVNNVVVIDAKKDGGSGYKIHLYDKMFGMNENFSVTNNNFADVVLKKLNTAYKRAMIVNGGVDGESSDGIIVVLPIYSMQDWIAVQDKLLAGFKF